MQTVLDRSSKEARELARTPVGKTWVNYDALTEAMTQLGTVAWLRRGKWGGEARGAFTMTERKIWARYKDGTDEPSELVIAITVDALEDVGRGVRVFYCGGSCPVDRYQLSGTVYYLRDDDLALGLRNDLPGGAVVFEDVLRLPDLVYVSGLQKRAPVVAS